MIEALTGHADADEASDVVETCGVVVARVAGALVDVHLAPAAGPALRTLTAVGAGSVDASAAMLAWVAVNVALVDIIRTVDALQREQ